MGNPSSNQNSPGATGGAMPRVLIADPSTLVIDRVAALINDVAQLVGHATNTQDAIAMIRNGNPHLTVFDVAIANGVDLLRYIKTHQPPVIAVVLTHSAEDTTRHFCMRLGAEYFLDKIRDFHRVREIVISVGRGGQQAAPDGPARY
jgi:DNA-binding NarL/FixJ family response regulator